MGDDTKNGGEQLSVEQQIKELMKGEELDQDSYQKLNIDGIHLKDGLKPEDKTFLNDFKNLTKLSINHVHLKSLDNLPTVPIEKLEISDNLLSGEELVKIVEAYKDSLIGLKACNNKISNISEVLALVKGLPKLMTIDLSDNEVCKVDDYRKQVFEANKSLEVLDGTNQDGEEADDFTDDEDYGEEGEFEMLEKEMQEEILKKLDPEMKQRYLNGELGFKELAAMGLIDGDLGEEGEFDLDDEYGDEEGEEDKEEGEKKQKTE